MGSIQMKGIDVRGESNDVSVRHRALAAREHGPRERKHCDSHQSVWAFGIRLALYRHSGAVYRRRRTNGDRDSTSKPQPVPQALTSVPQIPLGGQERKL